MTSITPDEGIEWFSDRAIGANGTSSEVVYDVAVGTGSASVSASDTQLDVQEHRADGDSSTANIEGTASQDGVLEARITVSGGTEVPAGTDITELGVWARDPTLPLNDFRGGSEDTNDGDDQMVYREVRSPITIQSGDRKTFSMKVDFDNA